MSTRATNSNNYPSVSWADTLDVQWSALRWDVKRAMKSLCSKLEEIGEQCFVVTVNVSNGWVGHLGTVRGDEYIDEKSHILYDFLNYCAESLDYDNCEEGKTNNNLDTENSDVNVNENKETVVDEGDTPIRISRPGPAANEMEGSDSEDRVIVQTPVQYQSLQSKANQNPSELQLNNLILLKPIGLPLVTQNVAMSTNIPEERQSMGKQTEKRRKSVKGLPYDQASGNKRKRKQSFEGIVKHSRDHKLEDNAPRMPRSKILTEPNSKKTGNHSNQADSEETESAESANNSDISESDRVLRSKSLHGYKTRRKLLSRKQRENNGNSDVDEENDWDKDDDDYNDDDDDDGEWSEKMDKLGRFLPSGSLRKKSKRKSKRQKASNEFSDDDDGDDDDDVDDEDWSEEMLARDNLGRFLPRKRSKNKRKRQKASEFSVSFDNTNDKVHNEFIEVSSIADGSEFDKEAGETNPNAGVANEKDPVKSDDEFVSQNTEQDNDKVKTSPDVRNKFKKRKGKVKSHEKQGKRKSCEASLSDSVDVEVGKDNKDNSTEQTGKESVDYIE